MQHGQWRKACERAYTLQRSSLARLVPLGLVTCGLRLIFKENSIVYEVDR